MDTHTRISRWLDDEVEKFINSSNKTRVEFTSKKNFVDSAVMKLLEEKGVKLSSGGKRINKIIAGGKVLWTR